MRLIDADALKEFINECKVCDICPNKKPNCVIHCDFPDYLTPIWEKVIDSIPTIDDLSEYSDKLWQKAYERGKAEGRKTGHWIKHISNIECSNCGEKFYCEEDENCQDYEPCNDFLFNFCPNCGAKMTKEAENDV